jgi:hypothetical protein
MTQHASDTPERRQLASQLATRLNEEMLWSATPQGSVFWSVVYNELCFLSRGKTSKDARAITALMEGKQPSGGNSKLSEYVEHHDYCKTVMAAGMPCQCGLQALLDAR